jgi:hypothetical protein
MVMSTDFKNLQKLVNFCKKNQINSLKLANDGAVEFTITPAGLNKTSPYLAKKDATDEIMSRPFTDEQTLFWSSDMPSEIMEGRIDG